MLHGLFTWDAADFLVNYFMALLHLCSVRCFQGCVWDPPGHGKKAGEKCWLGHGGRALHFHVQLIELAACFSAACSRIAAGVAGHFLHFEVLIQRCSALFGVSF